MSFLSQAPRESVFPSAAANDENLHSKIFVGKDYFNALRIVPLEW
jgi:hypothetical protein